MGDDAEAAAAWLPPRPAAGVGAALCVMLLVMPGASERVTLGVTLLVMFGGSERVALGVKLAGEGVLEMLLAAPTLEPDGATLCVMLLVMFGPSERVTLGVPAGVLAAVPVADGTMLGATLCVMLAETLNVRVVVMVGVPAGVLAADTVAAADAVDVIVDAGVPESELDTVVAADNVAVPVTLAAAPCESVLVPVAVKLTCVPEEVPEGVLVALDVEAGVPESELDTVVAADDVAVPVMLAETPCESVLVPVAVELTCVPEEVPEGVLAALDVKAGVPEAVADTPPLVDAVSVPDAALTPLLATEAVVAVGVPDDAVLVALAAAEVLGVAALEAVLLIEAPRVSVLVLVAVVVGAPDGVLAADAAADAVDVAVAFDVDTPLLADAVNEAVGVPDELDTATTLTVALAVTVTAGESLEAAGEALRAVLVGVPEGNTVTLTVAVALLAVTVTVAEVLEVAALEVAGEAPRAVLVGVPEEVTLTAVAEEGEATPP